MRGYTTQGNKIATAIADDKIGVNVLVDELFDRYFDPNALAMAVGNQIYLRRSSANLLSETVHEGTHVLDYLAGVTGQVCVLGKNERISLNVSFSFPMAQILIMLQFAS